MKSIKTKIAENAKSIKWASIALVVTLAVAVLPYIHAFGELGGEPLPDDTIPVSVPVSDADIANPSTPSSTEAAAVDDAVSATEQAAESVALSAMGEEPEISPQADLTTLTFDSNGNATIKAGDTVTYEEGKGTFTLPNDKTSYTLTVNGTFIGHIKVPAGKTLNLKGTGTIQGKGSGSVIIVEGNGAKLNLNKDQEGKASGTGLTIKSGKGTKLTAEAIVGTSALTGGGILVKRTAKGDKATLNMYNGTITSNTAQAGAGIFIDRECAFVMKDGVVKSNKTIARTSGTGDLRPHEGGGIYVAGPDCKIEKGQILKNTAQTITDWGGGGIFIESKGKLTLSSIEVTGNTAYGLGGGISGCPHAAIGIGEDHGIGDITDGAAIYKNTAYKNGKGGIGGQPDNVYLKALLFKNGSNYEYTGTYAAIKNLASGESVSGDIYAYNSGTVSEKFTKENAMDFYCTRSSIIFGQNLNSTSDPGRVSWTGISADPTGYSSVTISEDQWFGEAKYSLGLTATATSANGSRALLVQGNTSFTHGGGIGCNGTLAIGKLTSQNVTYNNWSIDMHKKLLATDGTTNLLGSYEGDLEFELFDKNPNEDPTAKVIATAKSDKSGLIRFNVDNPNFADGNGTATGTTYTLYAREKKGNDPNVEYDARAYMVKVTVKKTSDTAVVGNVSTTTTTCGVTNVVFDNGNTFENKVKPTPNTRNVTNGWSMSFDKSFTNAANSKNFLEAAQADLNNHNVSTQFQFGLYAPDKSLLNEDGTLNEEALITDGQIDSSKLTQIAQTTNDASGKVTFNFVTDKSADEPLNNRIDAEAYRPVNAEGANPSQQTFTFFVRELLPSEDKVDGRVEYDTTWHKVEVTVKTEATVGIDDKDKLLLKPTEWTTYTSSVADSDIKYFKAEKDEQNNTLQFVSTDGNQFTNIYRPEGDFSLNVTKEFYGDTAAATGRFNFSMVNIPEPNLENNTYNLSDSLSDITLVTAQNGAFTNNTATVAFDKVSFVEPGDYWFMISEDDAADTATDSRIYVIKVNVVEHESGLVLSSEVTDVYYAEGVETNYFRQEFIRLNKLWSKPSADAPDAQATPMPTLEFSNFSNGIQTFSLFGFAVNAATNEPIDQQCFVDPKIIKNLSGRSLVEGEFNFKLIELYAPEGASQPDWSQTEGPTISETSNDVYGMVDFDKANNVSGDLENPSCLAYTMPGTYFYRVVEANEKTDPTIDYSDQIITFTTVIKEVDGKLVCTEMYYGYVEDGVWHEYDGSAADPNWHPDMYNFAKNMSLQVRKTSALDRDKGLEGATYGLYAVNEGAQADILLGESTSDADGWITFEDLSLNKGTLYYFKEVAAPAGHTVSEFRSAYFYLVDDSSSPNGYSLEYSDNKIDLGEKATEAELAAASEAPIMSIASDEVAISAQSDNAVDDIMKFVFARDGGVYDEATNVEFTKLDTRTHEWVEGADLSIIEKSTGNVVNNWVSGKSAQKLQGVLNVGTVYILRENSAPEGYAKAEDVEFQIGQYGAVEILKGASNGNAEIQDSTIALYDTMLDGENLITEYREVPGEDEGTTDEGGFLPKLGDFMKIAGPVIIAIVVLLLLVRASRRRKEGQQQ